MIKILILILGLIASLIFSLFPICVRTRGEKKFEKILLKDKVLKRKISNYEVINKIDQIKIRSYLKEKALKLKPRYRKGIMDGLFQESENGRRNYLFSWIDKIKK